MTNPYQPPRAPSHKPAQPQPGACPTCGERRSQPVSYTWWGGWLGPKVFNHVACLGCGATFNSKTGRTNTRAIAIYLAVTGAIGLTVGALAFNR